MSILHFPMATSARRARPAVAEAASALWVRGVEAWRARKADRAMHLLSDDMLHDIGVARSEIEDVTRHGRPHRW